MRKVVIALIVIVGILAFSVASQASDNIRIFVNGKEIYTDVSPQIVDGRVMVPARFVAETLGADVNWYDDRNAISINWNQKMNLLNTIGHLIDMSPDFSKDLLSLLEKYSGKQPSNNNQQPQQTTQPPIQIVVPQQQASQASPPSRTVDYARIQAQREQIKTQALNSKAEIENKYQIAKNNLDTQKKKALTAVDDEMIRRGIYNSGIAVEKRKEVNDYYDYYYKQLESWRINALNGINNWESESLQALQ